MPTNDRPPNTEFRDKHFLELEGAIRASADLLLGFDLIGKLVRDRIMKNLDERRAEIDARQIKK